MGLGWERVNYHFGYGCSEAVLFWAKHAPNSENESSEDRKVDNWSKKKKHFTELVKDAKSVAGFSPSCKFQFRQNYVT